MEYNLIPGKTICQLYTHNIHLEFLLFVNLFANVCVKSIAIEH